MALARMATHGPPLRLVRSALASCEPVCVALRKTEWLLPRQSRKQRTKTLATGVKVRVFAAYSRRIPSTKTEVIEVPFGPR
jgi:hypothetical protein